MPLYDLSVESLSGLPDVRSAAILSDCDGTLFRPLTNELYDDAADFIAGCGQIALVSANPDDDLLEQRKQLVGTNIAENSDRPVWNKARLFRQALQKMNLQPGDPVIVLGDRAVADVWIGKKITTMGGYACVGVRIKREEDLVYGRIDGVTRLGYGLARTVAEKTGQAHRFRPAENSADVLVGYTREVT